MALTRLQRWLIRYISRRLDFAGEFWSVPQNHPARKSLRALIANADRRAGVKCTSSDIESSVEYYITRTLLLDVIDAAGAVEFSVEKLIAAAAAAQTATDAIYGGVLLAHRPSGQTWSTGPEVRVAYLEFTNGLIWTRSLDERMDRGTPSPRWLAALRRLPLVGRRFTIPARVGLVNCLAPGQLRDDVERSFTEFRRRTADARALANYSLHAALVPGGGTPRGLVADDGRIILRIPDSRRRYEIFDEFEYRENREALAYAKELLAAVEKLVDEMLDAFDRARPARFGP